MPYFFNKFHIISFSTKFLISSHTIITRLAIVLFFLVSSAYAGPASVSAKELTALRQFIRTDSTVSEVFKSLKKTAEESMAEQPSPIKKISSEGRLASDAKRIATHQSLQDMDKMEALAWVGAISSLKRYRVKAGEYILSWAKFNVPDGNPINETLLEPLVVAFDLVKNDMSEGDREVVVRWLKKRANFLVNTKLSVKQNWQSHRLKMVGLIALVTEDDKLWDYALEGFLVQMDKNFSDDGESIDFVRRDALAYHLYTVEPLLELVCAARGDTEYKKLFALEAATSGASLKEAVDFIIPYVNGEKRHLEYKNTKVNFDKKRARYDGTHKVRNFNAKRAIPMLNEAGCFSESYTAAAAKLGAGKGGLYTTWRSVINNARLEASK